VKGWRCCSIRCAREDRVTAMLRLNRYTFVDSVEETGEGVRYVIDLSTLPAGDGPAAELMVRRDIERAVALHRSTP
jgi:hypothetical protein